MSYNGSGTFVINTAGQPVVSGTVISSTAFNALTADLATGLSTAITKDGQTTPTANIPMGNNKITGLAVGTAATDAANLSQVQSTVAKLVGSVSGVDTITGTMSPTLAAYAAGQMFYFVAASANTGAVTINIDSLGAKSITRDGTTALAAGDIQSGEVCVIVYDGTQFQLVNGASQSASIVTENLTVNKATVLNESGGDNDTRIEGDTDANLFFADASTDRIGIGTSSPGAKLTIAQASNAITQGFLLVNAAGTGNGGWYHGGSALIGREGGVDTIALAAGNVGIGTSSPGAKFHVKLDTNKNVLIDAGGTGSCSRITAANDAGSANVDFQIQGLNLIFATAGNERARIDSSGNLGIANTSPGSYDADMRNLVVGTSGATGISIISGTSSNGTLAFGDGTGAATYRGYVQYNHTSDYLVFGTAAAERARITSDGKLLVNCTNGNGRLTVRGPGTTTGYSFEAANSGGATRFLVSDNGLVQFYKSDDAESARITSGGDFGIGTTSPGYRLEVFETGSVNVVQIKGDATDGSSATRIWQAAGSGDSGFIAFLTETAGTGTVRGSIDYNRAGGQVRYNTTSDYRAKEVYGLVQDSGEQIDALKVYRGKMLGATQERPMMIAHEAQEVVPYAVGGEKDAVDEDGTPKYQTMDHQILVPLLIAELQSLRKRVAELEAK